jgi:hypothetical protein
VWTAAAGGAAITDPVGEEEARDEGDLPPQVAPESDDVQSSSRGSCLLALPLGGDVLGGLVFLKLLGNMHTQEKESDQSLD